MKGLIITIFAVLALALTPALVSAQTDETSSGPPVSQPLVREGALAVKLAAALNLGSVTDEAEAEGLLATAGIAPRNGWIADYPVTPDIVGELRTAIAEAAEAGRLKTGRDASLRAFDDIMAENQLAVNPDTSRQTDEPYREAAEPDPIVINNYYYNEGPPVVTYYAPPPYYSYLYTWVPYPFWWSSYWFPGFYVLVDFDRVVVTGHHRHHFSNHVFDRHRGKFYSINPATRSHGGRFFGNVRTREYRAGQFRGGRAEYGRGIDGAITRGGRTFSPSVQGSREGTRTQVRPFISPSARNSSAATAPARSYRSLPQQRGPMSRPAIRQPMAAPPGRGTAIMPRTMDRAVAPSFRQTMPETRSFAPGSGGRSYTPSMGGGTRSYSPGPAGGGGRSSGGRWR